MSRRKEPEREAETRKSGRVGETDHESAPSFAAEPAGGSEPGGGRPPVGAAERPGQVPEVPPAEPAPARPAPAGSAPGGSCPEGSPPAPAKPASPPADPLTEARNQAAEYLDQLQRLQAEFDNYRRRTRREQEEWFRLAKVELLCQFLPVLDDLRRAREHAGPDSPPDAAGLLLILRRLEDALAKAGLEEQKVEPGTAFDPELHEALLTVPSAEQSEGAIVQVVEPGYLFEGRLIRRGKVACSSGPQPE